MKITDPGALEAAVSYWQGVLGLCGWKISVRWDSNFGGERGHAISAVSFRLKTATLQIVHPDRFDRGAETGACDPEASLVHELLHCVLSARQFRYETNSVQDDILEQAVEQLSQSFVKLNRLCEFSC